MKARILYLENFTIPKSLPHAEDLRDADGNLFDDPIFRDCIYEDSMGLVLQSLCGTTIFPQWSDDGTHYTIPSGTTATFSGAWAAMNAVCGISFPNCKVINIESTYGKFQTLHGYELARKCLQMIKTVEAQGRLSLLSHALSPHCDSLGNFKP